MHDQIAERWETQNEAGRRFFGRGDLARAEQAFTAAIREAEQLGAGDLRLATSLANLAQLKLRQRAHDEAERLFRRSLEIREAALGSDHASLVQTVNGLAAVCYARGDVDGAEPLFRRSLAITERRLGAQHPDTVTSLNSLARIAFKRRDYAAAGPLLERLLLVKESTLGPDHPEAAPILTSLMKVRAAEGALDEAERLARRVVSIRQSEQPPNEVTLASSLESLADVLSRLGKRDDERAARQRAAALRSQPSADSGALEIRHAADDIFTATPLPDHAPRPSNPGARIPSAGGAGLILPEDLGLERIGIPESAPVERPSPISAMPLISMIAPTESVPRRKTPTAAPPPMPASPHPEEKHLTMETGADLVPLPAAPPRSAPPPPPPVRAPAPARQHEPEPRPPRIRPRRRSHRESTSVRRPRRGGRKMVIAVALLVTAGAAAAAWRGGGVIESRGATGEPSREFVPPRRRAPRVVRVTEPSVDSIAAAVRDSVALLLGQPPVQTEPQHEPGRTPAQGGRDPGAYTDPDDPSLPPVDMRTVDRKVGTAAETRAANARAKIDSATRNEARPTFSAKLSGSPRP